MACADGRMTLMTDGVVTGRPTKATPAAARSSTVDEMDPQRLGALVRVVYRVPIVDDDFARCDGDAAKPYCLLI